MQTSPSAKERLLRAALDSAAKEEENGSVLIDIIEKAISAELFVLAKAGVASCREDEYLGLCARYYCDDPGAWVEADDAFIQQSIDRLTSQREDQFGWRSEGLGCLGALLLFRGRPDEARIAWEAAGNVEQLDGAIALMLDKLVETDSRFVDDALTVSGILRHPGKKAELLTTLSDYV